MCARRAHAAGHLARMLYWMEKNVLSVSDFTWAREAMQLILPDGTKEEDRLRGKST